METTRPETLSAPLARPAEKPKFPKSIPYIVGNEAAERFSFYGMKAILAIFLVSQFSFSNAESNATVHLFIALTYFMSIVGGLLADWFLGKYATIFWLSLVYCAGHACLAMFDINIHGFLFGLLLITIGAGGIKPCVSANVGDQFDSTNQSLISKMFNWFYFAINLGAFFSTLLTPYLYQKAGAKWAFGVPGILMGLATLIFWLGRKKYVRLKPRGFPRENFVFINGYMLKCLFARRDGISVRQMAEKKFSPGAIEGVFAVWRVLAVFAFIPVYWALYDQNGSEWVLQARDMNLHFLGIDWYASQIQAINPILILVFIPLFSYVVYPLVERIGIKFTPLRKIGTGFFVLASAFLVIAMIQTKIDRGGHPNIAWQILAYTLLTASEILVSITGLEYAYTQAPKSMKSTIMAFFLMTVFVGDLFVSLVNTNIEHHGIMSSLKGDATYYWFFLVLLGIFTVIYLGVSKFIKEKSYLVEEADEESVAAAASNDGTLEH
ncbi:MAG TPA: POT family MFS transporter [Edaphocola sp.]|nr:POT family MFS transporter [Edaphocola sp.]